MLVLAIATAAGQQQVLQQVQRQGSYNTNTQSSSNRRSQRGNVPPTNTMGRPCVPLGRSRAISAPLLQLQPVVRQKQHAQQQQQQHAIFPLIYFLSFRASSLRCASILPHQHAQ